MSSIERAVRHDEHMQRMMLWPREECFTRLDAGYEDAHQALRC